MGSNDTFVNMDEVRGWGVRALREIHGKKFSRNKGKCLLKIMAGTGSSSGCWIRLDKHFLQLL